jgi:PAS domain S-box-containing protein
MPKSLNKIFISIIVLFLLIGTIALYLVYENVKNDQINNYGEILSLYTNKSAETLESFLNEYESDLKFTSSLKDIRLMNKSGKEILSNFYNGKKEYLAGITRIDKEGKIVFTVPLNDEVIGLDVSNQDHNRMVMSTKKPVISEIFTAVQGFKTIALAYPIFDENNNYEGTLSTLIPFRHISEKIISDLYFTEKANVNLISDKGNIIYSEQLDQIGKNISEVHKFKFLEKIFSAQKSTIRDKGVYEALNDDYVYAYSTVQLSDKEWIVVLSVPFEKALESMQSFQSKYILIILSFGTAILLSSIIFFRIRRKFEQENIERQLFFNLVAERTGQIIYDYYYSTGIINWAGAIDELTGFSKEEFEKFTITDWKNLIHVEDKEQLKHFEMFEKANKYQNVQYRIKKSDGNFIFVEDRNVILENPSKHSLRIIGTIKDINDQKLAEQKLIRNKEELELIVQQRTKELEKLNKALEKDIEDIKKREIELQIAKDKAVAADKIKSDFLAQISHEIRTPISAILNFSQLLFDEFKDKENDTLQIAYNSINSASKRMIRTIDLILNVSEVQAKSYDYLPEKFNIYNDSLLPLYNEFKVAANNKNLTLEIRKETDDLILTRDLYSTTQIFANLIDNAIKYTKSGGVNIIIEKHDKLEIKVTDTGIGISDDYLPSLFEPFTQEETGYTRKFDGTGLGMALVQKYCELNNLTIKVESKKNIGTTFTVIFN